MNRRTFLTFSSLTLSSPLMAKHWNIDWSVQHPNDFSIESAVAEITKGKQLNYNQKVQLITPGIAENSAVVPVKIKVDSPMLSNDYIKNIYILTNNRNARTVHVTLRANNAKAYFATRVKVQLSGTHKIIALAEQSNGDFFIQTNIVRITNRQHCW